MAQWVRLAIFLASLAIAGLAFFGLSSFWRLVVPVVVCVAASAIGDLAFNRLASREEKRRDLEDRTRNPPS